MLSKTRVAPSSTSTSAKKKKKKLSFQGKIRAAPRGGRKQGIAFLAYTF